MKKKTNVPANRVLPAFANETEEADWWYRNRNEHSKELIAAVKQGEVQVLTKDILRQRIAASRK